MIQPNTKITRIPIPNILITDKWEGQWFDLTYAIKTDTPTLQEHEAEVSKAIQHLVAEYEKDEHHSVTLREKRRKFIRTTALGYNYSLVEFDIRDSY